MQNRTTIINELKEISPLLADLPLLNPYSVPYLYFERLPEKVMGSLLAQQNPENSLESSMGGTSTVPLPSLPPKQPFEVPQGYFEGLAGSIMEKIHSMPADDAMKETSSLSPLLASLPKTKAYSVPAGYFESLPGRVIKNLDKQAAPENARVIKMPFARRMIRYAAAAAITGLVALSVFFLTRQKNSTQTAGTSIDNVPLQELENYISGSMDTDETTVDYANSDLSANDIREFIGDISDEALQQYLSQNKAVLTLTN